MKIVILGKSFRLTLNHFNSKFMTYFKMLRKFK